MIRIEENDIVEISFVEGIHYELVEPSSVLSAVKYDAKQLDRLYNGEEIVIDSPYRVIYRLASDEDRQKAKEEYEKEVIEARRFAEERRSIF